MIWEKIERILLKGYAVDLGTVNTLIYCRDQGIILNEPSAVAIHRFTGEVLAVGRAAMDLLGREPRDVIAHRPIQQGVIANDEATDKMLNGFLQRAGCGRRWPLFELVISTPSSSTPVERRALITAATRAKAARISLVEEGLAAAIGAGVLPPDGQAHLVVDIGGGTTNINIVSGAGVIAAHSTRVAGRAMDQAITDYVREQYKVVLSEQASEALKINLGDVPSGERGSRLRAIGKSVISGAPQEIQVSPDEIVRALEKTVQTILESVRLVIEQASPETAADLFHTGITLTGGGSLLQGLVAQCQNELSLPVQRAENPLESVVTGVGLLLKDRPRLQRWRLDENLPEWQTDLNLDYHVAR